MADGAQEIIRRYDQLAAEKQVTDTSLQSIADNLFGRRDFTRTRTPGERRGKEIYDGTAGQAKNLLAAFLHTALTNTATKWFRLGPEDTRVLEIEGVAEWFEDAEEQMYNAFNRSEARFMTQLDEVFHELVGFGTAGLFIEDVPGGGLMFSSRPLSELVLAQNASGMVDNVFRKFPYTGRQAMEVWSENGVPDKVKRQVADGKPDEVSHYLHWVRPRTDVAAGKIDFTGMPWASTYLSLDEKKTLSEGGFREMPYMTPRWRVESGETYGRGPGWDALADGKMLNAMKKTKIQAAQLAVSPPWLVDDDGLISQLRTAPLSVNIQRSTSLRPDSVRPLVTGSQPELAIEEVRDTRGQVRGNFHWELLQLIQDPRMTATQVLQIAKQTQILLSPTLGRQHVELLEPMVERVFAINRRQGRFLEPPPEIVGTPMKVDYISAVARAQKASEAEAIINAFTVAANMNQSDPGALDVLNVEDGIREIAEAFGVPARLIRSTIELREIREAKLEEIEAQQEIENATKIAGAVADLAPVIDAQAAA